MCCIRGFICMEMQHSIWIIEQVPPWDVVRKLRVMQFCNTTFLIIANSEFSRLRAWLLSFKGFWVNSVKASMWTIASPNPTEGTKIAAKWSYQWNTGLLVHQAHINGKFAGVISKLAHKWPWAQGNPGGTPSFLSWWKSEPKIGPAKPLSSIRCYPVYS